MAYVPALKQSEKKSSLAILQTTFNRQRRKIDQLQAQIESLKKKYEQALILYLSNLKPKEKKAGDLVTQFIIKSVDLTQDRKVLTKKERDSFQKLIEEDLDVVLSLLPHSDIHDKLKDIYKEIHGKSMIEDFHEEMSRIKKMFKEEAGITDIDISNLDPNDSLQEMLRKIAQSAGEAIREQEQQELPPHTPKPKSKKELLREKNARDLEDLQNKGLSNIYKRLAKVLHPDLEQDLEKRAEKATLMKRLTTAYENQDLVSLLALEAECFETAYETLNEETFKIYNSLLKDQAQDLKNELAMISHHPRYVEMQDYIQDFREKPVEGINNGILECDHIMEKYTARLKDLSGKNPLKLLKDVLSSLQAHYEVQNSFLDLLCLTDFLDDDFMADEYPKTRKKSKSRL